MTRLGIWEPEPRAADRRIGGGAKTKLKVGDLAEDFQVQPGTLQAPFPSYATFLSFMKVEGVAAQEMLTLDLKRSGVFLCRSLSMAGVTFEVLPCPVTPAFCGAFDPAVRLWQQARDFARQVKKLMLAPTKPPGLPPPHALDFFGMWRAAVPAAPDAGLHKAKPLPEWLFSALKHNPGGGSFYDKAHWGVFEGVFWGAQQRFGRQMAMQLKVPTVAARAVEELRNGKVVVFGIISTGEAAMGRTLARRAAAAAAKKKGGGGSGGGGASSAAPPAKKSKSAKESPGLLEVEMEQDPTAANGGGAAPAAATAAAGELDDDAEDGASSAQDTLQRLIEVWLPMPAIPRSLLEEYGLMGLRGPDADMAPPTACSAPPADCGCKPPGKGAAAHQGGFYAHAWELLARARFALIRAVRALSGLYQGAPLVHPSPLPASPPPTHTH